MCKLKIYFNTTLILNKKQKVTGFLNNLAKAQSTLCKFENFIKTNKYNKLLE